MNTAAPESPPAPLPQSRPRAAALLASAVEKRWPRWLFLVPAVFLAHVILIFVFGQRHFPPPRPVSKVPQLTLAAPGQWIALNDPTLFALPHASDFIPLQAPAMPSASFQKIGQPRWLPLAPDTLGAAFDRFMRTNFPAAAPLNFKPPPASYAPSFAFQTAFPDRSTLRIQGGLARRRLLNSLPLSVWPCDDVLAPTKLQVLVDASGDVVSVLNVQSSGLPAADRHALELARMARFSPGSHPALGVMIFNWLTVPPPATHAVPTSP
ncbi:MAG: energy transducer TonB [Verrucomicrobiota bacterium]|nr:energy transducer TonB [Verrucomicrobiota bacterium]